jgi:hypothetical protein
MEVAVKLRLEQVINVEKALVRAKKQFGYGK